MIGFKREKHLYFGSSSLEGKEEERPSDPIHIAPLDFNSQDWWILKHMLTSEPHVGFLDIDRYADYIRHLCQPSVPAPARGPESAVQQYSQFAGTITLLLREMGR